MLNLSLSILILLLSVPILAKPLLNPQQVVTGFDHTCALEKDGVVCWGSNLSGQLEVPTLTNPSQISAKAYHTCALDDTGVKCWGSNNCGQLVPTASVLAHPRFVSAGFHHTCIADEKEYHCWGGQNDPQELECLPFYKIIKKQVRGIKKLTSHIDSLCYIDEQNTLECETFEGRTLRKEIETEDFSLMGTWSSFGGILGSCLLKAGSLTCIDIRQTNKPLPLPPLTNPRSPAESGTCTIDDSGVVCWDPSTGKKHPNVPSLTNPVQISSGFGHNCAIDDSGVVCWGNNAYGQLNVPR